MFKFKTPTDPSCKLCISYIGARFAMVLVIGVAIGGIATQFVEFPPSTAMIQTIAAQKATATEVDNLKLRTDELERKAHTHPH